MTNNPKKSKPIDELIKRAEELPPLPKVAHRALRLLSNPDFNMKDLAAVLSIDQALTSILLHWANSSYYGLRYPVSTVHQAVTYLGEVTVRSLVLTASLSNYLERPIPGYFLNRGDLWKHSVSIAICAKHLMRNHGNKVSEEAYTAGLLCDIGKLAFDVSLRKIEEINPEWMDLSFSEIEVKYFGIDHTKLGAEIARRWGFPESLQQAIAFHHKPSEGPKDALLPSAVHISDIIVSMLGIGIGRDGLQYNIDPFAMKQLEVNESDIDSLMDQVTSLIHEAEGILNP